MNPTDYYRILKIPRNTTSRDIKKAYRRLARAFHPDVNTEKDAAEKFKAIGEAYAVLGDETSDGFTTKQGERILTRGKPQPSIRFIRVGTGEGVWVSAVGSKPFFEGVPRINEEKPPPRDDQRFVRIAGARKKTSDLYTA